MLIWICTINLIDLKGVIIMAATITVPYADAVVYLFSKLNKGDIVSYAEISSHLKSGFPGINDNQIAGLINKMSNNLAFKKSKVPGSKSTYEFNLDAISTSHKTSSTVVVNLNKTPLENKVAGILESALIQIQKIPYHEIKESEDGYLYLEKVEKGIRKLIDNN